MHWAVAILVTVMAATSLDSAMQRVAGGDVRGGVAELIALAEAAPDAPEAPEALFEAARLSEDELADPAAAQALFARVARDYPDSRVGFAAQRRAARLAQQLGASADDRAAASAYASAKAGFTERGEAATIAAVEAVLAAHPGWAGAVEARLWIADVALRAGRAGEALRRYLAILDAGGARALTGAASAALALGRWDDAEAYARRLPAERPSDALLRADLLDDAAAGRRRARLFTLCLAILAMVGLGLTGSLLQAAGSVAAALRRLRPPLEVWFLAPVTAVLIAVAMTTFAAIAPAVAIIGFGGLGLTWLSGAGLEAARGRGPARGRVIAHAAACAIAAIALVYVALHRGGLLDLLLESVRFGPDL